MDCSYGVDVKSLHDVIVKNPPAYRFRIRHLQGGPSGFALVITLSLMVLLTVIAVGLLGLSVISLRGTSQADAMAVAKANARMAMMLALGELQKEAGPDQRITASASILDSDPLSPEPDGVAGEHLLGVWDAHTGWLNEASIRSTHVAGREPKFRRWLVSGAEPDEHRRLRFGRSAEGDVELVGSASSRSDHPAMAGRVPVDGGATAWWIAGENQKADVSLIDSEPGDSTARIVQQANAIKPAIDKMEGLESFKPDREIALKLLNADSAVFALQGDDARMSVRRAFHELASHTYGVLADVRKGGLRKDFNSAMESASLPAPLAAAALRQEDPGSLPAPQFKDNINFPSWYKLFQYYGLQNNRTEGGGLMKGSKPTTNYVWAPGNLNATGYDRTPIIARAMLLLSAEKQAGAAPGMQRYRIGMTPVLVAWNPYSAKLQCQPLAFNVFPYKLECQIFKNGVGGLWQSLPTKNAEVKMSSAFALEAGESKIFSPSGAGGTLTPGFRSPNSASGLDITPPELQQDQAAGQSVELALRLSDSTDVDHNGGRFQIYWTMVNAGNPGERFNEMAANPCRTGQPMMIVSDRPGQRFALNSLGTGRVNMANFQFMLKTGQDLRNPGAYSTEDLRCKNFIHADPVTNRAMMGSADPAVKRFSQYMIWAQEGTGNALNPDWESSTNRAYFGNGVTASQGQTVVPMVDLAPIPVTSLAMLQHFKMGVGRTDWASGRHNWEVAANQALGIGNSFAHPMIPGDSIYANIPQAAGSDPRIQFQRIVDHWDRGFLCNDGLWDEWFCSGFANQSASALKGSSTPAKQVDALLKGEGYFPNSRLVYFPNVAGETTDSAKSRLIRGSGPARDAWRESSRYMLLRGAFNVNSTSVEAWKAFLASSSGGKFMVLRSGTMAEATVPDGEIVISRFAAPVSDAEGSGPQDPAAWTGVRYLTSEQIDRLARECVHQVKRRGPFLNMSDFINRRLANDESGVCGALQAAIDWDEFGGNSPKSGDPESINGRFKDPMSDYISSGSVTGSKFPAAAAGSRYTGIPGYVTQADLLKRIGNGIAVRDDSFRIRGYGEARDPSGKVVARAWCESLVQRLPKYLDASDAPELPAAQLKSNLNRSFGRVFAVVSFRWLAGPAEI